MGLGAEMGTSAKPRNQRLRAASRNSLPLALAAVFALAAAPVLGDEPAASERQAPAEAGSIHDHTVFFRFQPWFVSLTGDVSQGDRAELSYDDLGLDDTKFSLSGKAGLRWKKFDFWIDGFNYENGATQRGEQSFTFDGVTFPVNVNVNTDVQFSSLDFRLGYAFWTVEEDGFRLSPVIDVGVADIDVEFRNRNTGARTGFAETVPVPGVGVHLELPWKKFNFEAEFYGIYADVAGVEGWTVRGALDVVWRLDKNIGFVAGYHFIGADIDVDSFETDPVLHGPAVGLEVRF